MRLPRTVVLTPGLALAIAAGVACGRLGPEEPDWWEELEPTSTCYDVDLLDGLDESSTAELRALYDCLDHNGHFTSLRHGVDSLEAPGRDGVPAGVEVARLVNALPSADVDPFALAGLAVEALRAEDRPVDAFLDTWLELSYGGPAGPVRAGTVSLTSSAALESGVLVPLAPVVRAGATALLDDDLDTAAWAGGVIADPETRRWIRTFESWLLAEDPTVAGPVERLLPGLGAAILSARSPENDHHASTTGDSLRDLVEVLLLGDAPLAAEIGPEIDTMLGDAVIRTQLERSLLAQYEAGHLQEALPQAKWMASVDIDGGTLKDQEDSGLTALLRLLHDTNTPMRCSLDLWVTSLEVDLGNLAVALLELLADQDPSTISGGVGLLGSVLGWDLSEWLLEEVADSGVCPAITHQVTEDLQALDLLAAPETEDLLVVLVDVLSVLKNGQSSKVPELVDLVSDIHAGDGVPAVEEALRDLAEEPLVDDIVSLVPVLVDPAAYGITAGTQDPVDLQDALSLAIWLYEEQDGRTGYDRLAPLARPVIAEEGLWTAAGHLAVLLVDEQTRTSRALELVPPLLAIDPDLALLDQLAPLLADEAIAGPLLRAVETDGVVDALLASEPQGKDPEVPLAFAGRLIVNGALDDLLAMVDTVLGAVERMDDEGR